MQISSRGRGLIKSREGLRLTAYLCPASKWTVGWGHTGPDVKPGMVITVEEAERLLSQDLAAFERDVTRLIGDTPTTQGQFDALVSFAFNVGSDIDADSIPEGLGDSTLMKRHNQRDYRRAADEFLKWNKARIRGGPLRVLPGLTKRRAEERALYLS